MKFSEKMWFIIIVKATEKSGLHPLSQGFLSGHPLSGLHTLSWKHNFKKNHMVDQIDPSSLFRVYDKLMTSKKNCLQNKGHTRIILHLTDSYIFLHENDCKTAYIDIYVDLLLVTFIYVSAWFFTSDHEI